jgi:hypothetical protein
MTTASVTILPGVPGMPELRVDDGVPYPESTVDFVKVLRHQGVEVEYDVPRDQRRYVGHKAYELWLPIVLVAREVLVALEAGILVEWLKSYLPADQAKNPTLLHVDWRVRDESGTENRFRADGAAPDVLDALDVFERGIRDE